MPSESIRFRDLFLFQIGDADSIRRIVASRWSLVIGALLVFTAAIARNYDKTLLLHDGGRFAGPFIVPIISSFLVFFAIYWSGTRNRDEDAQPGFFRQYPGFLGAFLITAPLAWFYAIPVESMTDDLLTAAKWNVVFLSLVSLWRVWLITRVARVITGAPFVTLLLAILIPASIEALVGAHIAELNLVGIMGGIVLPPDKEFLAHALEVVGVGSFYVFCGSVAATIIILISRWKQGEGWSGDFCANWINPPKRTLLMTAGLAILWIVIAIPGQQKIRNRELAYELLNDEKFDEALEFLRSRERRDFPPDNAFHDYQVKLLERLQPDDPFWIHSEYLKISKSIILERLGSYGPPYDGELRDLVVAVSKLPGGREALRSTAELILDGQARNGPEGSAKDKRAFIADLEAAGVEIPEAWRPITPPPPSASAAGDTETTPVN